MFTSVLYLALRQSYIAVASLCLQLVLMGGHYAVFRVSVTAPNTEGDIIAEVFVETQFEHVVIPVRMTVLHGNLEIVPESLVLDDCFPVSTMICCVCVK